MKREILNERDLVKQVEKICNSPEFRTKQVLCRFLSYIVSETLAGRGEEIKGYSIGVDVFNRDEDFDPGLDTLVRINAIRLRRMLDLYYSKTGKKDDILIKIPKGGYLPLFISKSTSGEVIKEELSSGRKKIISLNPYLAVLSFTNLSGDPENAYFVYSYTLKQGDYRKMHNKRCKERLNYGGNSIGVMEYKKELEKCK